MGAHSTRLYILECQVGVSNELESVSLGQFDAPRTEDSHSTDKRPERIFQAI